jgi:LEA14-like dessication related protein
VEVKAVALASVSLSGVRADLDLAIVNPNAVALPLRHIDWEMAIAGDRAVTGDIDLSMEIPAKGTAPVQTSIAIGAMDAARVAPKIAQGRRDYALRADLRFATSLGDITVTVESRGTL